MVKQLPEIDKNTSQRFDLRAFVRRVSNTRVSHTNSGELVILVLVILTLLTKALRSKRREVFLSILGSCYSTLDSKLFKDAATLLPGYMYFIVNVDDPLCMDEMQISKHARLIKSQISGNVIHKI